MTTAATQTQVSSPTPEQVAADELRKQFAPRETVQAPAETGGVETPAQSEGQTGQTTAVQLPAEAPKVALSEGQLRAAKHLGYTDEEIAALTPQEVRLVERSSARVRRVEGQYGRMKQQMDSALKTVTEPKTGKAGTAQLETEDGRETGVAPSKAVQIPRMTPDDSPDDFYAKVNAIAEWAERSDATIAEVRKKLAGLEESFQESAAEPLEAAMDDFFSKLDSDIFPEFGRGRTRDLDPDSPESEERGRFIDAAAAITDMYEKIGRDDVPLETVCDEALQKLTGERYGKFKQKSAAKTAAGSITSGTARPTGTQGRADTRTPEQRAADELAKYMRTGATSR